MQDASSNIIRAVTGDAPIWDPQLYADWALNGYGAAGSFDDLSGQSSNYQVTHNTNDGLPDEVSFLAQAGVPTLTAGLSGRPVTPPGGDGPQEFTPLQYFSPFQSKSPLYGYPRDIAPVKMDQGVVTDGGVSTVRLFTGQMADTPIQGGQAQLQAISRTRLLLSRLVQPPPIGNTAGTTPHSDPPDDALTSTWPVSWALHRCGVYPSPPPVSGAFFHMPMHGGMWAFSQRYASDVFSPIATTGSPFGWGRDPEARRVYGKWTGVAGASTVYNSPNSYVQYAVHPAFSWVSGPYVAGANAWLNATEISMINLEFQEGDPDTYQPNLTQTEAAFRTPYLRVSNNSGRAEMYVRGDALNWSNIPSGAVTDNYLMGWKALNLRTDINAHPGASGQAMVNMYAIAYDINGSKGGYLYGWVSAADRLVRLEYWNGSTTYRATSGTALPSDGLWHHIGFAWSITDAQKLWVTIDGHETNAAITVPNSAALCNDFSGAVFSGMGSMLPLSEIQWASGKPARPDLKPWMPAATWTRGAYVRHGDTEMPALLEQNSSEAFAFLQEVAQAEAATMRIDENDIFHWRPPGYYATPGGQTQVETLTTDRHAHTPEVRADYSRVRNVVRVSYTQATALNTATAGSESPELATTQVLPVPPGTTTYRIALDRPVLWGTPMSLDLLTIVQTQNLVSGAAPPYNYLSWVTLNTSPDGGGYNLTPDGTIPVPVSIRVTGVRAYDCDITFVNSSGQTYYTANALTLPNYGQMPTIWWARPIGVETVDTEVIELDVASAVLRGPRVLELSPSRINSARMASRLARRTLARTAWPVAVVDSVELFGDPRRQPGDLVRLQDTDQSGFNHQMRTLEIQHKVNGPEYTQTARMQQAQATGRWGDGTSRWGTIVWSGSDNTAIGTS